MVMPEQKLKIVGRTFAKNGLMSDCNFRLCVIDMFYNQVLTFEMCQAIGPNPKEIYLYCLNSVPSQ